MRRAVSPIRLEAKERAACSRVSWLSPRKSPTGELAGRAMASTQRAKSLLDLPSAMGTKSAYRRGRFAGV